MPQLLIVALLFGTGSTLRADDEQRRANLMAVGILQYCGKLGDEEQISLREETVNHFFDENAIDQEGEPVDPDEDFINNLSNSARIDKDLARRFLEANRKSKKVRHDLFPREFRPHTLATDHFNELFKDSAKVGWKKFRDLHPETSGIVTVSNLTFSADGNTALMSIWHQYGHLGGSGSFLFFRRVGKLWTCNQLFDAPSGIS